MPVEGRGLSRRRTQDARKDRGIDDEHGFQFSV